MNERMKTWRFAAMLMLGVSAAALAQDTNAQKQQPKLTRVITVSHVRPESLADAINAIASRGEDPTAIYAKAIDHQRLLLFGYPTAMDAAMMHVVGPADQPQTASVAGDDVEVIPLGNAPSPALPSMLETFANKFTGADFAIDAVSRTLVVRADAQTRQNVRRLLAEVDRPSPPIMLEFYFLSGTMGGGSPEGKLPNELAGVAKALSASGIGSLSMLAPLRTGVVSGEDFFVAARRQPDASKDGKQVLDLEVSGVGTLSERPARCTIELQAQVHPVDDSTPRTRFELRTALTTALGEFSVLAAGPATTGSADTIILVVRATPTQ